jgi:competence protein ComEA
VRALAARLESWRSDPRAGALVLALLAVAAGVFWFRSATRAPSTVPRATSASEVATTGAASTTTTTAAAPELVVHVAGAVARPGVVRLAPGARVVDALDAAGGASGDADLDRLNLAALVTDGERVAVPRVGEPAPPAAGGVASPGAPAAAPSADAPLDLNTATATDLEALPGIGPTLAAAIVADRERNGPFGSVDDLLRVRGIGEGRLEPVRDLVRV